MRHHIEHALTDGSVPARKALLQALVHEIRFEGRDRVVPWSRVPGSAEPKVRALARSAPQQCDPSRHRQRMSRDIGNTTSSPASPTLVHVEGTAGDHGGDAGGDYQPTGERPGPKPKSKCPN